MLSLPSKPWKKVKIDALGDQDFRITFLTELESQAQFLEAIEEDLVSALGARDRLGEPDWPSRAVTLTTADLVAFKRKLIFSSVMVDIE